MNPANKVALITGGASGLGAATAELLATRGAKVALLDIQADKGKALAATIGKAALSVRTDVTDEQSVQGAIAATRRAFGAVHICVNCAGTGIAIKTVGKDGPHPLDAFERLIKINLIGTFNVIRLAAHAMQDNDPEDGERGVIVNTASVAALEGQMGQAAYSASKGGVAAMTIPIARDLAKQGIRVNCIAPGLFDTPLLASAPEKVKNALAGMVLHPQRLGQPVEYAALALHLIENGYLNSEVIRLDGGIRMQPR